LASTEPADPPPTIMVSNIIDDTEFLLTSFVAEGSRQSPMDGKLMEYGKSTILRVSISDPSCQARLGSA
jgi:hypothetical protein